MLLDQSPCIKEKLSRIHMPSENRRLTYMCAAARLSALESLVLIHQKDITMISVYRPSRGSPKSMTRSVRKKKSV